MTEKTLKNLDTSQTNTAQGAILKTLIDIGRIITTSHNLEETLNHTVELVAENLGVDACNIYIYDPAQKLLELRATHGLRKEAVGQVRMPVNEGLVGFVFESIHHVNVRDASHHPRFKYFPAIDEERLSSFLGVPLVEFRKTLGVLAVQNQENRLFTKEEENLLITIASQISGLISKAMLVDRLQQGGPVGEAQRTGASYRIEGIPVAPGLAMDKVFVMKRARLGDPPYHTDRSIQDEKNLLTQAIRESEEEILELIQEVTRRVSERDAAIFHAHLLFLEDRAFLEKISEHVHQGASAAWSVSQVVKDYLQAFRSLEDPYLAERAADLEDVGTRLLNHLGLDHRRGELHEFSGILAAEMLLPSDTALLDPHRIKGIITEVGGHVSHAAILARSLRIPAISGVKNLLEVLREGEEVMVDGESGSLFINPDALIIREYERYQHTRLEYLSHLADLRDVPCRTLCGTRLLLRANVALTQDLEDCVNYGAEGIGLYRTEMQYLMSGTRPSEQDLREVYTRVLEHMPGQPVVFRLLDLGSDRSPTYLSFPQEDNPYLGLRSIRYQMQQPGLLKEQLFALMDVAVKGNVQIMVPMISHLQEIQEFKRLFNLYREEYAIVRGKPAPHIPIGMLFEVPAAIVMCDLFMNEVDFVTIGSNDLTQYVMAVDRNNPHVGHLYDPLEPAVLTLIRQLIESARRAGRPLDLTGEVVSDPDAVLLLTGMGVRSFSMNAPLIPIIKDRIAQFELNQLKELAHLAMNATSADGVRRNIRLFLHN
ncbi:MAG: phosphoenolpyruvate--protein phosphotransferase [Deltaproteobacteria bacterium]|nr:phosphoenolpyruvate--protein phosphotransferase [Deltaproteobacteria bacterium]